MEEYIMYFWAYIYNYSWTVGSCLLCAFMVKFDLRVAGLYIDVWEVLEKTV